MIKRLLLAYAEHDRQGNGVLNAKEVCPFRDVSESKGIDHRVIFHVHVNSFYHTPSSPKTS